MASWMYRRGGTPEEMHAKYGLRRLTWRDALFWRRFSETLLGAALWSAGVLWLLSGLYEIGPITILVVAWIGLWTSAIVVNDERFERDLRRWPRRTDTD